MEFVCGKCNRGMATDDFKIEDKDCIATCGMCGATIVKKAEVIIEKEIKKEIKEKADKEIETKTKAKTASLKRGK